MNKFAILSATLILLLENNLLRADSKMEACGKKFLEQIHSVDWVGSMKKCIDFEKLKCIKNDTEVIAQAFNKLSKECKEPTKENIDKCSEEIKKQYNSLDGPLQSAVMSSGNNIVGAIKGCVKLLKEKADRLDKYILGGCQGDL